jgi:DNA repair protein RadD
MLVLRPYQERAIEELYAWLERNSNGNPIVDMCVGAGKSVVIAELCKRCIAQHPTTRIVMTVSSRELCLQNMEKLLNVWPEAPVGVCSAALGGKDLQSQIIFATIGSIARKADVLGRVDLLLVDECHGINSSAKGMYRHFIDEVKRFGNPNLCVIGFTGTPFRGNGVWLHHGEDVLFNGVATKVSMTELLKSGHLSPLVVDDETPQLIDTTNVRVSQGDYVMSDLNRVVNDADLITRTVNDIIARGASRKKWLVYCVTIEHAENVLAAFIQAGINTTMVTGDTPAAERKYIINQYKHGDTRCLVNVAVLTTGFDAPNIDLIALLRPTLSPVLYVQIAGRGMRTADGKADCLWLDYTPTTANLGAVNLIKGRVPPKVKAKLTGFTLVKHCDECGNACHISVMVCPDCGHEYPVNDNNIAASHFDRPCTDALPLHGLQPAPKKWLAVNTVTFKRWDKNGKISLRVTYNCGLEAVHEWLSFEGFGYAFKKASEWWAKRWALENPWVPKSVDEALMAIDEVGIRSPNKIQVEKNGKYWSIKDYEFEKIKQHQATA